MACLGGKSVGRTAGALRLTADEGEKGMTE